MNCYYQILKKTNKKLLQFFSPVILFFCLISCATSLPLESLKLPKGFSVNLYATELKQPRQLALGKNGIVFVGTKSGKVYALTPSSSYNKVAKTYIIASDLHAPNGVAYKNGSLYVAETNRVLRYDHIDSQLANPPTPVIINDKLPNKSHHGLRVIKFGPDGLLYIGVGMPCNICVPPGPYFGTILRMQPNGSDLEVYAKGIRNTVGFDWNPSTHELWFTDNGRDWLGDNLPPDELNKASSKGLDFGFPYYYGKNHPDPKFTKRPPANQVIPAEVELGPHVASLGMIFYSGKMFPQKYYKQILIAEHGSWNRSKKIGYRVTLVTLENGKPISYQPFIEGWLQNETYWGRPVDLLTLPDGSLLISDDYAGVIYRVTYQPF